MNLSELQEIASILQSFITTLAIIIGGLWGYTTFILKRGKYPKAKIEHTIIHRIINDNMLLLSADIFINNVGDVLLSFDSWEITVKQMLPPASQLDRLIKEGGIREGEGVGVIQWRAIDSEKQKVEDKFIIEPGESQQFHRDYVIHSSVKTIMLISFFKNIDINDRSIGWDLTSTYDL